MNEWKLIIDTRVSDATRVLLYDIKKKEQLVECANTSHAQSVLALLVEALDGASGALSDIKEVEVLVDSGSYMGRRVGVAIARTLGYMLQVPVNGHDAMQDVDIPYEQDKWK